MNNQKSTEELEKTLESTHPKDISSYLKIHSDDMVSCDRPFCKFIKNKIKEKGLKQQDIFLKADIPERYGYKLLSEEKRTKRRDVILRICFAVGLDLVDTEKALALYEMPSLYPRIPRDAVLMILLNKTVTDIDEVNRILMENNMETLKTSGKEE